MKNNFGNFKNENEFLTDVKNAINFRKQRNIEKNLLIGNFINLLENKRDCIKNFQVQIKEVKGNNIFLKGYSKPFNFIENKLIRGKQIFIIVEISKLKF